MAQSSAQRTAANRLLGKHGLGQLSDPGLMGQLGFLVRDHDHFRSLLNACEPSERRNMYESLRPNLRFEAKPLDSYVAELAQAADVQQLPVWNDESKSFEPYRVAELRSQVQDLVEGAVAKQHLTVVCRKCTFTETFSAMTKQDAVEQARDAGWVYSALGEGIEICPTCPATRA